MKLLLIAGSCLGVLGSVAAFAAGCSAKPSSPTVAIAQSALSRNTAPIVDPADAATLIADNDAFASGLYQTLSPQFADQNMFFSPYSISLALAQASVGANGDTATQMATALHFTLPPDRLHPAYDALDLALNSRGADAASGTPFTLRIASSLWAAPDMPLVPAFLDVIATDYGAGVRLTDFTKSEDARGLINQWVSDETNAKIPELLPEKSIDASTRLILANAVYFKAAWGARFSKSATSAAPFHAKTGDVSADMMHLTAGYPYAEGAGWKAVSLPYEGNALSLVAVLPDDLAAFESSLGADSFRTIKPIADPSAQVALTFPKLTIEGKSFSLHDALKSRGMVNAFDPSGLADFSGMTSEQVYIRDIIHDAFVSIDEDGTEAAAATAVVFEDSGSAPFPPTKTIDVTLDKPFLFFIRDNATGAILFVGRFVSP